ncbi:hypothetical protein HJC23_012972 [Cyclotella cryptica]|uniref:Myb-like domain-containing protein n=1 Tax=Cyclotella cryptica TaxID=29204 RepID=A0ABD3QGP1_9STRA
MATDNDDSYALPNVPSSDDEDDEEVDSEDETLESIVLQAQGTARGSARCVALTAIAPTAFDPPAVIAAVSVAQVDAGTGGTTDALHVALPPGPPDAAAGANTMPPATATQNSQPVNPQAGWAAEELEHVLESISEYLPISGAEWDLVADRHSQFCPELERTGDQLKETFNKLSRMKVPTGEPNIPLAVEKAKALRILIIKKSEGSTGY